jgi:hypothetical protein
VGPDQWSFRIGADYRAMGAFLDDLFVWDWIGSHQKYDQRVS